MDELSVPGTAGYATAAPRLASTRLDFVEVNAPYLHLFPTQLSRILDLGSGPGHDAAAFARMGHEVVAAEPEPELLRIAMELYGTSPSPGSPTPSPGSMRCGLSGSATI